MAKIKVTIEDESGKQIGEVKEYYLGLREEATLSELLAQYSRRKTPLPIVAITDGAKSIRNSLFLIFGVAVTVILDWYHLNKKAIELFSMIARNKQEKQKHLDFILPSLWKGDAKSALAYLATEVTAKNPERLLDLIAYLEKHQAEIINYEDRSRIGKTIGSGRMEKAVDLVIGKRQKDNGMSWSRKGSKALAILKVQELNGNWDSLWNFQPLAA